ncbi:penicillin-binding transpeptidase domain-containing protein [Lactococcus garvieae]|uniref:Cell division protein FtsI n=1 Tax=Lactococcus garvieae DCC43 TaxID=1231377 RepID=K2PYD3_9LACT|nr:penicillin-binding transpeptidase domain-containing protein [Lactococcus garvieae]EKF52451.1 Cell division protein FtsI [Lactococcus garvieae DCC43]
MSEKRKTRSELSGKKDKTRKLLKNPAMLASGRVKLLFFVITVLFLVLIGKLYHMQIMNQSFYESKQSGGAGSLQIVQGAPRGNIYDAKGVPLATTEPVEAIEYTRGQNTTADDMRKIADRLAGVLTLDNDFKQITERDKKDYFLADADNLEKIAESLTKEEKTDEKGNSLSGSEIYNVQLSKVTDADINFNEQQMFAVKLFKEMNSTTTFNTTIITTSNLTAEQQAYIGEHEGELQGISVGTSWNRKYADTVLKPILGTVTTQKQGIPSDLLDEYLKEGFQRNDRVGTAFLEKGYEKYLQGTPTISTVLTDKQGNVTGTEVKQKGSKGDNLKLTVDMKFQNAVDKILQDEMNNMIADGFGTYSQGAYAVVLDSKTGAVLALSGLKRDETTGAYQKDTNGTFQSAFVPGSVVKPATLTAGWNSNVIAGNQMLYDMPIQLAGTSAITSWFTSGSLPINAVQALEYSSNTYMVQIALKMLGQPYVPNMTVDGSNSPAILKKLREVYASYGMGTTTGFDIPGEIPGIVPAADKTNLSALLMESFGQFDTYTPLQLATYGLTLANNGERLAPHIVDSIYETNSEGGMGDLVKNITPKIMDKVNITPDNMDVLHQGMSAVVHGEDYVNGQIGATGYYMRQSQGAEVSISAKTGTAEVTYVAPDGTKVPVTVNNVVAFAPTENPQISIGVMVPQTTVKEGGVTSKIGQNITREITNLYNSMYHFK